MADRLERDIADHDSGLARATAIVSDPELTWVAALAPPDLASLTAARRSWPPPSLGGRTVAELTQRSTAWPANYGLLTSRPGIGGCATTMLGDAEQGRQAAEESSDGLAPGCGCSATAPPGRGFQVVAAAAIAAGYR
ncbi:MAG: hypothetical protein U0R78_15430 [Nocardioidaceae bacterium]